MKTIIIILFSFLITFKICAQNLIKNGSFEDTTIFVNHWHDYINLCKKYKNDKFIFLEKYDTTFLKWDDLMYSHINIKPPDGLYFESTCLYMDLTHASDYLLTYFPNLYVGKKYEISFYCSAIDTCQLYVNNIDVLFCDSSILKKSIDCIAPFKIPIEPSKSFNIKKLKGNGIWTKFSFKFRANKSMNTFVIGNFSDPQLKKYWGKRRGVRQKIKDKKLFRAAGKGTACYYLDNFVLTLIE